MKFKRTYVCVFIFFMAIMTILGLTKINMINTKALSPIGNADDNYEKITSEFGEDFDEFIQDKAIIKIYNAESDGILVKVNELSIKIKEESPLINKVEEIISNIFNGLYNFFDFLTDELADLIS